MNAPSALITDPMAVFAYIAAALGIVFWASTLPNLKKFFNIIPPIILAYFVPTLSTTFGITPMASPAYDWMRTYLLPIALLLLMITVDLRAIMRLGPMALIMMVTGTVGIIIGGPIALAVFGTWLPEDAWKATRWWATAGWACCCSSAPGSPGSTSGTTPNVAAWKTRNGTSRHCNRRANPSTCRTWR